MMSMNRSLSSLAACVPGSRRLVFVDEHLDLLKISFVDSIRDLTCQYQDPFVGGGFGTVISGVMTPTR